MAASWVKHLLCKHEDPSLDAQNPCESLEQRCICCFSTKGEDTGGSRPQSSLTSQSIGELQDY